MTETAFSALITRVHGNPVQIIQAQVAEDYAFEAGQYLLVYHNDIAIPLSIASSPTRLPELELHYRSTPGAADAEAMDKALLQRALTIGPATGDVRCGAPEQPLLVIAGGSGAALAFACAEYRASLPSVAPCTVLWCADEASDIYADSRLATYQPLNLVIKIDSQRSAANEGLLWLQTHAEEFRQHHIVLSGSPGFVYAATDTLLERGIAQAQMQSDVYAYAPR
ncbi:MAG: hypothetical protein AAF993_04920 [Pseudomonadota bacterium]